MKKTFYYEDELKDDFGTTVKKITPIPKKYKYVHKNIFVRLFEFFIYRIIVRPLAWLYVKIKFWHRLRNKKVIKNIKGGFFIFGNHVTIMGDAFIPNLVSWKRRNYIITGEQANSLTALLPLMNSLGLIPLSQDRSQQLQLLKCVKKRIGDGHTVTVYPEAHVWPFYTGIRPFAEDSFRYALIANAPVVAMTTCFQKKWLGKKPKAVTYLDGPFYPKEGLSKAENVKYLRDLTYNAMKERASKYSTYSYFEYKRKESINGEESRSGEESNS